MRLAGSINTLNLLRNVEEMQEGPCIFDLSGATFVEPVGLVGLAAITERAVSDGREVQIVSPLSMNVGNYLSRMKFNEILDGFGIEHDLPPVRANPLASELVELSRVVGEGGGETVAKMVYDKLDSAGVSGQVTQPLYEAICEVTGNVKFHAEVPHGYVAAQTMDRGGRVLFAIADSGQGLRASLSKHHNIEDDAAAIELAVQSEVSGTGEQGRGEGLPTVVKLGHNMGVVHIASGNARKHYGNGFPAGTLPGSFPGTIIQVELSYSTGH